MLRHFNPNRKMRIEADASGFAFSAILTQLYMSQWHPVVYWSRKKTAAERNYDIEESEMLAIVCVCKEWRHYVKNSIHTVTVVIDHVNLRMFLLNKNLSGREARWWKKLSGFDLTIKYRSEKQNPADAASRRSDYEIKDVNEKKILGNIEIKFPNFSETALLTVSIVESGVDLCAGCRQFIDIVSTGVSDPDPLAVRRSFEGEIDEISKNNFTNDKTSLKSTAHTHISITDWISCGPSTSDSVKPSVLEGTRSQDDCTFLSLNRHEAAHVSWTFHLMGIAKVSRQNQEAVLKKGDVYSSASMDLRTVLKAFQKTDSLPERLRTATGANTGRGDDREGGKKRKKTAESEETLIQNAPKRQKTETRRLFEWSTEDGMNCHQEKWYVSPGFLRRKLLQRHHDDPHAGHFGQARTLALLKRQYSWPGILQEVKEYCDSCTTCHRVKFVRHKPHGLMEPLPQPRGLWTDVIMDFITDLPPSGKSGAVFDSILVVVNRYTKMAEYVSARKDWTAEKLANAFHTRIFVKHGMPDVIITDRGSLFTSNFWSAFCYHLIVELRYSTAFHPQTDGQTERQNSTLEQYLRSVVNYQQDDWLEWLPLAEFAYNNSNHVSTGISPFMAYTGRNPKFTEEIRSTEDNHEVSVVKEKVETILDIRKNLEARWQAIKDQQFK